jgi:hypothetical protein
MKILGASLVLIGVFIVLGLLFPSTRSTENRELIATAGSMMRLKSGLKAYYVEYGYFQTGEGVRGNPSKFHSTIRLMT